MATARPAAGGVAWLIGAALLAASILPLSTAYSVTESVGRESALDDRPREAPLFYGTCAVIVTISAALILVPGAAWSRSWRSPRIFNDPARAAARVHVRHRPQPVLMGEHVASRAAAAGYLVAIAFTAVCVGSLAVLSIS